MATHVPPKKNNTNGFVTYVSLVSQADTKIFQVNPTLAAGDVKIAIDDGAPANLGTLPAVDADFTRRVKVVLSQAETNGDVLTIIFSDAAGSEWCDLTITIHTSAQTLDEVDTNIDTLVTRLSAARAGYLDELDFALQEAIATLQTDLDNPSQYKADVSTLETRLSAVRAGYLDQLDFALQEAIAALNNISTAEVNAEVVDAIGTDTLAELGVGIPATTPTLKTAVMLLYMALRNKIDVDADWKEIHKDDGTLIAKKALTDNGTTYSEGKAQSG